MQNAGSPQNVLPDLNTICRCCLTRTAFKSIFDPCGSYGEPYSFLISSCTPIPIHENDGLPSGLCESCAVQLQTALKFYLQCSKTSGYLAGFVIEQAMKIKMESIRSKRIKREQGEDCDPPTAENTSASLSPFYRFTGGINAMNNYSLQGFKPVVSGNATIQDNATTKIKRLHKDKIENSQTYTALTKKQTRSRPGLSRVAQFKNSVLLKQKILNTNMVTRSKSAEIRNLSQNASPAKALGHSGAKGRTAALKPSKSPSPKVHFCDLCSRSFATLSGIKMHQRNVHFKLANLKCNNCGKQFTMQKMLDKHLGQEHAAKRPEPTSCGNFIRTRSHRENFA